MFEERYDLDSMNGQWLGSLDTFFFGDGADDRVVFLPERLIGGFTGDSYRLSYEVRSERCGVEKVRLTHKMPGMADVYSGDITVGLSTALQRIGIEGKRVLVDITGIKHPALFYLFKLLLEDGKPERLFAAYTEPKRYVSHGSSYIEERFQLFDGYLGIRALPGFTQLPDDPRGNKLLVVFLGFEGTRLQYVHDEVEPGDGNTIAVIGFPAFRPGWQSLTIAANQSALDSTKSYLCLRRAIAFSPFDAYRLLTELQSERPGERLIIAPIGTRPHALGAVLYAVRNSDSHLLYDFPIEVQEHRTEEVGRCHVYHLSSFL